MSDDLDTLSTVAPDPAWWTSIQTDYRAGMANVFLLHGNVWDYADHPKVNYTIREYLEARLSRTHTLASYAVDQGITFAGDELLTREARERFEGVLGRAAAPVAADDPTALLRAASSEYTGGADQEDLPADVPKAIPMLIEYAKLADEEDAGALRRLVGRGDARRTVPKRGAVLIERLDLICPPDDKARLGPADRAVLALLHRAGTSIEINRRKNLIILLASSLEEVHPDLRLASSGIRPVEIAVPDHDQRLAFVVRTLPDRKVELDGLTEVELASETAGLNRRHIEDIAMRAEAAGGRLTRDLVRDRKAELIKAEYAEVLEILEPDVSFADVGGHDLVKAYLLKRVLKLMRDPSKRARCPMGLLFAGPSGTGKTLLARALAKESGFNCVSMAPDNIRGSFVGESEKKLRKAIQGVQALSPCVLFVDEVDQKVKRVTGGGGGGGDSVEGNIFGKLLEFFSDTSHRGEILLVAATNRPDNIDAALKRPGRIDAKIPLLPPDSPEERADALSALAQRHDVVGIGDAQWLALGQQTDGYTQAELEGLLIAAAAIAETDELPLVSDGDEPLGEAFSEALDEFVPSTDDIKWHTDLAIAVCSNRKLVPARYRDRVGKQLARPKAKAAVAPGAARQALGDADDDVAFGADDE